MSLIAWLPLTKDLRNQGINNYSITVMRGSETWNDNGKLGKCFHANGVNTLQINNIIPNLYNINGYSLCAWFYIEAQNTVHSGAGIISGGNWNNQVLNLSVSDWSFDHYTRLRVSGTNWNNTYTYNFYKNTWYHAVVCSDGNKTYAYINGQLIGDTVAGFLPSSIEGNNIAIGGATYYSGMQFFGKINDVRIYDHCLSPMEVKQISQGLVLHYPLDRQGWGQENLATQYVVPGSNGPLVTTTAGRTVYYGKYGITIPTTENADTYFSIYIKQALESGKKYTLSCEVNGLSNGTYYNFPLFAQNNSSMGLLKLDHNGLCSLTFTMNYTGTVATSTVDGVTLYRLFMDDISRSIASGQGAITVTNIKLEEGDKVTPWCPAATDSSYTTMGLNGITEYDCSGFCNNGEKIGALIYTNNTPKYAVSTHIGATSQKIHISNFPVNGFGNSYSFAWWGKRTSNSPMFWGFSDGCRLNGMYVGIYWNTGDGSSNPIYTPGTTTTITAPSVNVWHHYVMTGDGTTCKLYVDGVLYGQAKTYKAISGTSIYINGWDSSTSYCSDNTDISDFRIYATALSASDVKSLYQNCATIDPDGTIRGQIRS